MGELPCSPDSGKSPGLKHDKTIKLFESKLLSKAPVLSVVPAFYNFFVFCFGSDSFFDQIKYL